MVMPRTCLVCGKKLGAQEQHLCIWCESDLPLTYYWEQAHNPMADEFNSVLERLRPAEGHLDYAYAAALLFYHHESTSAISGRGAFLVPGWADSWQHRPLSPMWIPSFPFRFTGFAIGEGVITRPK